MAAYGPTYPYQGAFPHTHHPQQPQQQARSNFPGAPSNWVPPPYVGAPPIPAGVNVNPQQWQAGVWQYNPAYVGKPGHNPNRNGNPQQQQQHVPWIPSHHWMPPAAAQNNPQPQAQQGGQPRGQPGSAQQQQQQSASFNPYKRQSRDPSAEYLALPLSDNPLGLFDMKPATVEEYYRQGHQTPWIWKPADLPDDASASGATDPTPNGASSSRRHSVDEESFTSRITLQPTFSSKIVRTPEHYRSDSASISSNSSPNRTDTPTRPSRGNSVDSSNQLSSRMSQLSISSNTSSSSTLSRSSTMPTSLSSSTSLSSFPSFSSFNSISPQNPSPTKPDHPPDGAPILATHLSSEPESMDISNLLSPLVLATPLPGPSRNLRSGAVRNGHPNPLLSTQSLDTIPEAPSAPGSHIGSNLGPGTGSAGGGSAATQQQHGGISILPDGNPWIHAPGWGPHTHHTLPNPPKTQMSYPPPQQLRDMDRQREREHREHREREHDRERDHRERGERDRERGLGTRYTTYVDPHVNASSSTPSPRNLNSNSSPNSHARPSPTSGSRPSSTKPSPVNVTPPTLTYHRDPTSRDGGTSIPVSPNRSSPSGPSNPPPALSNPLPPPPRLSTRPTSLIIPTQRTPPPHYRTRLRRGFWNRRGDHLTPDGYIVYAPSDRAFPDELRTYPPEEEGYQDHEGVFTKFVQRRPELPQSLPKRGERPECPYDVFVVYEYKQ